MKRIFALVLTIILALTLLAGCAKPDPAPEDPTDNPGTVTDPGQDETGQGDPSGGPIRGAWDGDTYTNEFSGIRFTLPAGWEAMTDEEIAELMSISTEAMGESDADISEYLEQTSSFYDAFVMNPQTNSNIIFGFENLSVLGGALINEETYLDLAQNHIGSGMPYDYTIGETYSDYTIGGRNYKCMDVTFGDLPMSQHYLVSKVGSTACLIIVTVAGGDTLDGILSGFDA